MSFMFDALVTITRFRIFEISFPRFQGAVSTIKKTLNLGDREHNYCNKLYHYKLYNKVELSPSKKVGFISLFTFEVMWDNGLIKKLRLVSKFVRSQTEYTQIYPEEKVTRQ